MILMQTIVIIIIIIGQNTLEPRHNRLHYTVHHWRRRAETCM